MGLAIDTITGAVTGVGATITPVTLFAGDSLTVRNAPFTNKVQILAAWTFNQTAGVWRLRSPRMHDNVNCLTIAAPATNPMPFLITQFDQLLIPQDTLIMELSGHATLADIAILLLGYTDLPGIAGRYVMPDFVTNHGTNLVAIKNTFTTTVQNAYQQGAALNAVMDTLKANTDYALIGYHCDVAVGSISWRGADSGNLRVSGPGQLTQRELTARWFEWLSYENHFPCIPVFNSANKAGITLDIAHPVVVSGLQVSSFLVELH
jgi:hypothetical protein